MPELPEVETVRRGLQAHIAGRRIAALELRRPDLRFPFQPDFRQRLVGRRVEHVGRRAKYLQLRLDNDDCLIAHLGMSGSFRIAEASQHQERAQKAGQEIARLHHEPTRLAAHDHVVLDFGEVQAIYNDPRRFGFMFLARVEELESHPRLARLGLEPLEPPITGARLRAALGATGRDLKAALLDQSLIAGLGNIYVCEALHRAKLSPRALGRSLTPASADRLADAIVATLREAVAAGGSTLKDFSGADGAPGYFQHNFAVYDREGATCGHRGCGGVIARSAQGGRSTFYCRVCQG